MTGNIDERGSQIDVIGLNPNVRTCGYACVCVFRAGAIERTPVTSVHPMPDCNSATVYHADSRRVPGVGRIITGYTRGRWGCGGGQGSGFVSCPHRTNTEEESPCKAQKEEDINNRKRQGLDAIATRGRGEGKDQCFAPHCPGGCEVAASYIGGASGYCGSSCMGECVNAEGMDGVGSRGPRGLAG